MFTLEGSRQEMLFVEWWLVGWICLGLLILAVPVFSFWLVRDMKWPIRITVRVLSGLVAICGVLRWLIFLVLPWPHSYSVPVYSPNRTMAARIDDYDAGPLGGADNSVELFTSHGFTSDLVYYGEWDSVGAKDLQWRSDSELEIFYKGPMYMCKSTRRVLVQCNRR
jgi:hypothetical protein